MSKSQLPVIAILTHQLIERQVITDNGDKVTHFSLVDQARMLTEPAYEVLCHPIFPLPSL